MCGLYMQNQDNRLCFFCLMLISFRLLTKTAIAWQGVSHVLLQQPFAHASADETLSQNMKRTHLLDHCFRFGKRGCFLGECKRVAHKKASWVGFVIFSLCEPAFGEIPFQIALRCTSGLSGFPGHVCKLSESHCFNASWLTDSKGIEQLAPV